MKIDGLNINYIVKGEGNNILILHGWGCNIEVIKKLIDHLSKSNKVYALDLPGFGKSDEPKKPWCVDDYVDLIIKFIEENKIKKISLIGHSFGGRIIIKLFNRKLNFKIEKVVLMDSAGIKKVKNIENTFKIKFRKSMKKIIINKYTSKMFPSLLDNIKKKVGSTDYRNATPIMRDTLVKTVNEDLEYLIPKINVPTLLIWGELDTETPLEDAYKMEKLINNAGLVIIKNGSHFAFLEDLVLVNKALDSFFGGSK